MALSLSTPRARELAHTRRIEINGYKRDDGLWDIEAQLLDSRPTACPMPERDRAAGEPIHDILLRLTIDDDRIVRDIEGAMPTGAYQICHLVTPRYRRLIGLRIGRGWNRAVAERLGGAEGCTHMKEMLAQMATTALQVLWSEEEIRSRATGGEDPNREAVGSCHAYRADGFMVRRRFPDLYTGPDAKAEPRSDVAE